MRRGAGGCIDEEMKPPAQPTASRLEDRVLIFRPGFPFSPARFPFFYGWVIGLLSMLGMIASIPGQTMGVGPFKPYLDEALQLGDLWLSIAYGLGTGLSAVFLPVGGVLLDKLGSRVMAVVSMVLFGGSMYFMASMDQIAVAATGLLGWIHPLAGPLVAITLGFFLIRILGQGLVAMVPRQIMGKWWVRQRGKVLAITGVGISFMFSLAPKLLDSLIDGFGWRGAYMVLGLVLIAGFGTVFWLLVRDNPEASGLVPDGERETVVTEPRNRDLIIRKDFSRGEALRTPVFWIINLALGFHAMFFTGYTFHVVALGEEFGLGVDAILSLFVPISFVSIPVGLAVSWLSDHTRIKYILLFYVGGLMLAMGGMLLVFAESDWPMVQWQWFGLELDLPVSTGIVVLGLGFGMSGGCFGLLTTVPWPRFFGREHLGAINGVVMSTMVVSSAVGPLWFAVSWELFASAVPACWLGLAVLVAMAVSSWWADNPQRNLPPAA